MENDPATKTESTEKLPEQKMQNNTEPKKSSKLPILIIVLLLILIVPLGGYFLMNEVNKAKVSPTPTEAPTMEAKETAVSTPAVSPTSKAINLDKSFTSQKFTSLSFSGYSLKYPSDWTLSEERNNALPGSTVTITKQNYVLKIFQAATGGAMCIYDGGMPEGPASDFRTSKFTEINAGFGTVRQTELPKDGRMAYTYCQKSTTDNSYGQPTNVGHMSVTTNSATADPSILKEIEAIITSIQAIK